jgi:hypothetical protein
MSRDHALPAFDAWASAKLLAANTSTGSLPPLRLPVSPKAVGGPHCHRVRGRLDAAGFRKGGKFAS